MASDEKANTDATTTFASTRSGDERGRRYEGKSTSDPSEMSDTQKLRFEATINGRYHTARQGWYERLHRWCMFVVVIGGTGAVAEAVGNGRPYSWLVALLPTAAGTIDLVFDFAGKAATHARLQEKSFDIVSDIELSTDNPEAICKRGLASIARICAQEPKTMRVVHALAYNDTKEGTENDVQDDLLRVPPWARFFRHMWAADGLIIQSAREARAARPASV